MRRQVAVKGFGLAFSVPILLRLWDVPQVGELGTQPRTWQVCIKGNNVKTVAWCRNPGFELELGSNLDSDTHLTLSKLKISAPQFPQKKCETIGACLIIFLHRSDYVHKTFST